MLRGPAHHSRHNSDALLLFCEDVASLDLPRWRCVSCYRDNMPSHFKFKEYCPVVFRNLRERFGVDEEIYLVSSSVNWVGLLTGHITFNRHLTVMKIQEDPLCPTCGEQEETSLHFLGECYANMQIRYSIFGAHLMQRAELNNMKPSSLLQFARATKRFSWPLVATGMCIGPNVSMASALSGWQLLSLKKRLKKSSSVSSAVFICCSLLVGFMPWVDSLWRLHFYHVSVHQR